MNIFNSISNIRIGRRLIGGFIIVTILMAFVGVVGFLGMNSVSIGMDKVYSDGTVPLYEVTSIETSLNSIRALTFRTAALPAEREQDEKRMQDEIAKIDAHIGELKTAELTPEEKVNLSKFEGQWTTYKSAAQEVFTLLKAGKTKEGLTSIANGGNHANARRATAGTFEDLKTGILTNSKRIAANGHAEMERTIPLMAALAVFVVILAMGLAILITRSITLPLYQVMNQFDSMTRGEISGRLYLNRTDEIGDMAGMIDRFSDYLEHDVVGTMHRIAAGDLLATIENRGAKDQITPAFTETLTALNHVIVELKNLVDRTSMGDLSVKGSPGDLQGSYRDIILGFNRTLGAIINPLSGAIALSKDYSECNFAARFPSDIKVEGDFCEFRSALNTIGDEISKSLALVSGQLNDLSSHASHASVGIEDVRRGAKEISSKADMTNTNAQRSEDGIEQVLKAMEDLTVTVTSISSNVDAVAQAGTNADNLAKKGIISSSLADEGMSKIKESSVEVERTIKDIQGQMAEITNIIKIITDISEQTNLLALNAAIEAARAGDAGLGFAVVAGEVKALANQTGDSTQKIALMISGLESQSAKAVAAMDEAAKAVNQGEGALKETVETFADLTKAVEEISHNMNTVAGAIEEQAASFEEITASVTDMSGFIKETVKDALNSSATAEEAINVVEQITGIINEINEVVDVTSTEMKRFVLS
ncbi:methyl-accepting chemotaxis protein [Methanospirillum stamsii]|nr:methyl-accepting chemotaxis protein [Methanospirillum stamsii]